MIQVLSIRDVSKRYAEYASLFDRLKSWFGLSSKTVGEFWASRNISFDVGAGEAVALIGQNGAGKSTLLKMITGTVRPSQGSIVTNGRVSAILELGIGFNPELTGRQNILHAGGLMGYSRQQLEELSPEIEAFAEVGEHFDQPVRTYSSGMMARLAFALATATRPDVLIVDEVLSVGDSYFQHKSFERVRAFKEQGTAVILVTHGMADVRALCDRVILLDKGTILKDGPPDEVVDYYNALIAARENADLSIEQRRTAGGWLHSKSGSREAVCEEIGLYDALSGHPLATATVGQDVEIRAQIRVHAPVERLVMGILFRDRAGTAVFGTNTYHLNTAITGAAAGDVLTIRARFVNRLGPGSYGLSTALHADDTHVSANYEWQENILVFDVINADRPYFIGLIELQPQFTVERT